ncbi:MAG: glycosyltransferase family 39 protein [bacterium]
MHKIKIDPHVIDKVDNSPIYIVLIVSIFVINLGMVVYQWPFIHSFWLDEWISIKTASIYGTSSFPYFPSENPISSGFIYFFFLHIANVLTHNYLHAGRFLNLLFYLGALYPLFSLAKKYTNSRTALLALLIYSTSYFLLTLENEVRGYIFSVALFYLFLFLIVCIQQRILKYILSAVALAILLDNNLTNIWFVFTAYLTSFLWVILNRKREFYQVFFFISLGLPVCALLAYKGNPADAIAFYYHGLIGGLPPWASYRESVFYPYSYSWGNIATILVNTIALSGIIAMLLYARDKFLKNKLIYLIIWLVVSYIPIMLAGTPAGYRYFFITSPIWALAIALSVTEFFKGLSLGQRIAFGTIIATSLFSVGILNAQDVMWSKTLDFSQPANFIKNALPKDTIVIPNYMGVQIGDYGLPIKYILYDEEIFFYNENAGNYGKKNVLGNVFNAKSGKHFILDASYINIQDLENLMNNEPFSVVVFIRPWPSDITQNTYNQLSAVGFREVPNMQPFRLFVLEKE